MSTVRELHDKAMDLADLAFSASRKGESKKATGLFAEAYDFERQAAERVIANSNVEPTRSILLRSAAYLAFHASKMREAQELVNEGLSGNPPYEIANELKDLQRQVEVKKQGEILPELSSLHWQSLVPPTFLSIGFILLVVVLFQTGNIKILLPLCIYPWILLEERLRPVSSK